jgi:MFS superfamily sulfate permease-like transporter
MVVAIAIFLNAMGLEVSTANEADLNCELQMSGIANLVARLCGGVVGHANNLLSIHNDNDFCPLTSLALDD